MHFLISVLAFVVPFQSAIPSTQPKVAVPRALREIFESRGRIAGSTIETQVVEDEFLPGRVFLVQNSFAANGDCLSHEFGDQDGWVQYEAGGAGQSRFPLHYLTTAEGYWSRTGDSIVISSMPRSREGAAGMRGSAVARRSAALDVRWIGLTPFPSRVYRAGSAIAVPLAWQDPFSPEQLSVNS